MFEETPKIEFTVNEGGKTIYRDAIVFESMAQLRNTSEAERQAMFQERYNQWKANIEQMTLAANMQEGTEPTEES